jgi:hypothetical protein
LLWVYPLPGHEHGSKFYVAPELAFIRAFLLGKRLLIMSLNLEEET